MRIEYLRALHESAARSPTPAGRRSSSALERAGELVAACPLYLKDHSYGEYVFDWAWADAYQRHGLRYYPKLLDAVPFTPVPGPRLLARDAGARAPLLLQRDRAAARDGAAVVGAPALPRRRRPGGCARGRLVDAQHACSSTGRNREPTPYADFADFLASLQRDKRKKIQQERAPRRRGRRHVHGARRRRRSPRPTGTSSTAATRSPTARTTRRRT